MMKSERNKTIILDDSRKQELKKSLLHVVSPLTAHELSGGVICGDIFCILPLLPDQFVDLLILDPPYNLFKRFDDLKFNFADEGKYQEWMASWFVPMMRLLKPTATVYLCGDWRSSASMSSLMRKYLKLRNRITWQREKGRGSKYNWKNVSEDIWYGTVSDEFCFNLEAVMQRRKVIAPYHYNDGTPKDWKESAEGRYRLTCPSNLWQDISVPYWSMPENTPHPTQKPEKLLAKLILASSNPGDFVFDPFGGVGTSAVVAKKTGRNFATVDINEDYCLMALERLARAENDSKIQGYENGVFLPRKE